MQNSSPSRKRPAPGTTPDMSQANVAQPNYQQFQQVPATNPPLDLSNFDFSQPLPADANFSDPSAFDSNSFNFDFNGSQAAGLGNTIAPNPSTELVRRARNQALAAPNGQQERWNGFGDAQAQVTPVDEEQDLQNRIARAKKDAQGKRKQIPPFVQKLWSFLESNNTDLIRWSDDGKSFIVLDEDEFARTMIPELFKHNNYASFVRQLNMYGFHKTVNITDGSLRQSEKARKGVKPPSMYSHEYFQRNQPELLWLIQKPGGKTSGKRKRDGTKDPFDSDDERQFSPAPEGRSNELSASGMSQDLTHLPKNEMVAVRHELQKLQTQQKFISQMITQLKEQNDQFYRQATAFQALHDRHENSINAILTFLATFYNRSMEGHGAQNLVNMFTNAAQSQQQHGSVVEEFNDPPDTNTNQQVQKFQKRPPLLLTGPPAPPAVSGAATGTATTQPNSARPSASPMPRSGSQRPGSASVPPDSSSTPNARGTASPPVKTDAPTPDALNQVPESNDQMLNIIQNATQASTPTNNSPAFDFDSLLGNAAAGPLTPQQRDNVVRSFANMQGGEGSGGNNNNNALIGPGTDINNFTSQLKQSNDALEKLTTLQKQQDERVQELNRRLQPLSPTGAIPGLDVTGNTNPFDNIGAPGDYDPNAFLDFDQNAWDGDGGDGGDFDFNFDASDAANNGGAGDSRGDWSFDNDDMFGTAAGESGAAGAGAGAGGNNGVDDDQQAAAGAGATQDDVEGGRVESVSSSAASPANGNGDDGETQQGNKRQKRA